ncbi:hypothetical protein BDW66DRAFT_6202 [Aspergillus desertorum]
MGCIEDTERGCHWIVESAWDPRDGAGDSIFEAKTLISSVENQSLLCRPYPFRKSAPASVHRDRWRKN